MSYKYKSYLVKNKNYIKNLNKRNQKKNGILRIVYIKIGKKWQKSLCKTVLSLIGAIIKFIE